MQNVVDMCKKQVVSEGCREAYVQRVARRTVRVCTGGRGRLGLDDLLLQHVLATPNHGDIEVITFRFFFGEIGLVPFF